MSPPTSLPFSHSSCPLPCLSPPFSPLLPSPLFCLLPLLLLFLVQVYNLSMIIQETDLQHLHVREFILFKSDLCLLFWVQSSLPPCHSCSQTTGDLPWSKTPTSNRSRYVLCTIYCVVYTSVGPFSHYPRFICFQHAHSHFTLGWAEFVFKILHKFKSVLTPLVNVHGLGNWQA